MVREVSSGQLKFMGFAGVASSAVNHSRNSDRNLRRFVDKLGYDACWTFKLENCASLIEEYVMGDVAIETVGNSSGKVGTPFRHVFCS